MPHGHRRARSGGGMSSDRAAEARFSFSVAALFLVCCFVSCELKRARGRGGVDWWGRRRGRGPRRTNSSVRLSTPVRICPFLDLFYFNEFISTI